MATNNGKKVKPTLKQQRAIQGMIAAIHGKSDKSIKQILRDAGYAPETARQWTHVMTSIRPHLQPALDWMEMHRAQIMAQMDEKIGKADYAELTRALDVVTRNHQLLGGKPTQNLNLNGEDRSRLDSLIDD